MSKHEIPVLMVTAEKHPNADSLGLVRIFGYQSVVQLKEFPLGVPTKAVFIPPDYVVPDVPEWGFLNGHRRITTRKFRGERSEGIIIPARREFRLGTDVMAEMGITRWVSPAEKEEAKKEAKRRSRLPWWNWKRYWWMWQEWRAKRMRRKCKPPISAPNYDVENYKRYPVLHDGEMVQVTEKIHGCNARYAWINGRFYVGSHTLWKNPSETNWWTQCAKQNPWIEAMCKRNPGCVFYGEIYGASVQPLTYGVPKGTFKFRMFDIREGTGEWASVYRRQFYYFLDPDVREHWVPVLYTGIFDNSVLALAEGKSVMAGADHIREGVVIEPVEPRSAAEVGRVKLKVINPAYLEIKHEGQEQYLKEKQNG